MDTAPMDPDPSIPRIVQRTLLQEISSLRSDATFSLDYAKKNFASCPVLQRHASLIERIDAVLYSENFEVLKLTTVVEELYFGWNGMPEVKDARIRLLAEKQVRLYYILLLVLLEHFRGAMRVAGSLSSELSPSEYGEEFCVFIKSIATQLEAFIGHVEETKSSTDLVDDYSLSSSSGTKRPLPHMQSTSVTTTPKKRKPSHRTQTRRGSRLSSAHGYLRFREIMGDRQGESRRHRAFRNIMLPSEDCNDFVIDKHDDRVYAANFTHDGQFLFTAGKNFDVSYYSVTRHASELRKCAIVNAANSRWTLTDTCTSVDNTILAYSTILPCVTLANVGSLLHNTTTNAPADDGDGVERVVVGADQGENSSVSAQGESKSIPMAVIDINVPRELGSGDPVIPGIDFAVWSIDMTHDKTKMCVGTSNHLLCLVDVTQMKSTNCVLAHHGDVNSVKYAKEYNPHLIITGSDDSQLKLWDTRVFTSPVGCFVGHTEGVTSVDAKGDGVYFISNGKDQKIKLWDIRAMRTGTFRTCGSKYWDYRSEIYPYDPRSVRHPLDTSLVSCCGHTVLKTLIKCEFSPHETTGGRFIHTGSADGNAYVYNWEGEIVRKFRPSVEASTHHMVARDVAWHPHYPMTTSILWSGHVIGYGKR